MRREFQIKFPGTLEANFLVGLGAQSLGSVSQEDIYLCNEQGTVSRIRKEKDRYLFTDKKDEVGKISRKRTVRDRIISEKEAESLINEKGTLVSIRKERQIFLLDGVSVVVDNVEHIGEFIEIRSSEGNKKLLAVAKKLNLDVSRKTDKSHMEMAIEKKFPWYIQLIMSFHERFGECVFGATSGVLTALGLLLGVNSATPELLPVIASILAIGIADSYSDSYAMYSSKVSERGVTHKTAMRYAVSTFLGKLFFSFSFIFPLILFKLPTAVLVSLVWGLSVLALVTIEHAIVTQKPMFRHLFNRLLPAVVALVVCNYVPGAIATLLGIKK